MAAFRACGVTPQQAALASAPDLIGHPRAGAQLRDRSARRPGLHALTDVPVTNESTCMRCVDCQSHVFPPAYAELLLDSRGFLRTERAGGGYLVSYGSDLQMALEPAVYEPEAKLRAMDATGVDMSVLSVNMPGPELLELYGKAEAAAEAGPYRPYREVLRAVLSEIGLSTVWVNRRQGLSGSGATPPAEATPDLTVPNLGSLAALTGAMA